MSIEPSASDSYDGWPLGLKRLAKIIGHKATLDLVEVAGGLDKPKIPAEVTPEHPWVKAVGIDKLQLLSEALGGQRIYIPRGSFINLKKLPILDLLEKGWKPKDIALEIGVTVRYVYQLQSEYILTKEDSQNRLF
ncbi:helix-turn-helix domain-containing protein [uncultured Kiloniella sp.]|uniref:helix-turn-helix domain-containing protein n=1 Tax=uncultured Kiloniella sp. TaxID=1133091 RepID=UPI002604A436|nr:helix-turn-helix domain-containing protein [uncultured Kiloniella sp.]